MHVAAGAVNHFIVHARKAVLGGLSPDANRKVRLFVSTHAQRATHTDAMTSKLPVVMVRVVCTFQVPPLRYELVQRLVEDFPHLKFTINGGLDTYELIEELLEAGVHGAMVGRAVTSRPWYWSDVDRRLYGEETNPATHRMHVLDQYLDYAEDQLARVRVEVIQCGCDSASWVQDCAVVVIARVNCVSVRATQDPRYFPKLRRQLLRHTSNLFVGERNGR